MSEQALLYELTDGVARVTLNRPDRHNAFDDRLIAELSATFESVAGDPQVRCMVLGANGKSFSAGADLNWMRRMAGYDWDENFADSRGLGRLMQVLDGVPQPTIAAIQGAAIGGGVGLVACCDIAIASDAALFCLSEVRLGLIPAVISPYVVAAMGPRQARRYFLSAERFGAEEARRIGLIHEVVAAGELDARVDSVVAVLFSNGPAAMRQAKQLVKDVAHEVPGEGLVEETARRIADVRASGEGREGVAAFLEKRKPDWRQS
jgi:methylglutaconyl-CoA hydratase